MFKQNTTSLGIYGKIEKIIRFIPHIYIFFRMLAFYVNYFEDDFYYLKKIFKNKSINIIDIGASDGISTKFFFRNLNPNMVYCFEPQKIFYKKLDNLKKKFKKIKIFNFGLAKKNCNMIIYIPFINFFGKKIFLSTYTFTNKNDLMNQINFDFLIKPNIEKTSIIVEKFKMIKKKIDLIKIDTNGSEAEIVGTLISIIKRDRPVLIIENNNIAKIYKKLQKQNYKKYCVVGNNIVEHTKQKNANIIFK